MKTTIGRACIYPKDIQRILGKEYKAARFYHRKIKEYFKKEKHQVVSVDELSQYSGLSVETVMSYLH